ncbi:hypothetical protein SBY92_003890 [Candida maltosa Xu316]
MSSSKPSTPVTSPKLHHPPPIVSSNIQPPSTPPSQSEYTYSHHKRKSYSGGFESPEHRRNSINELHVPSLPFTPSSKRRSFGLFESPVGKSPYGAALLKTPRNDLESPEQDEDRKLKLQKTPQFASAKRLYDTLNSAMSRSPNKNFPVAKSFNKDQLQYSPTKSSFSPIKSSTTPSPPNYKTLNSLPFTPSTTKRRSYGLFESPVSKNPSTVPLDTPMNDEDDAKQAIKKMLEKRNGKIHLNNSSNNNSTDLQLENNSVSSNGSTPTPNSVPVKLPSLDSRFTEREAAFSLVKLQSVTGQDDETETEDEED